MFWLFFSSQINPVSSNIEGLADVLGNHITMFSDNYKIFAHEMGHIFEIKKHSDSSSIMNGSGFCSSEFEKEHGQIIFQNKYRIF